MRRKKVQVALDHDGRPPLLEEAPGHLRKHSACQSIVADLTSIVSAAHKLPAEVDPPARVWASLRAQLEKEGILSCSVRRSRQKQTRFLIPTKMRERAEEPALRTESPPEQSGS
jgi:hypothetical protein